MQSTVRSIVALSLFLVSAIQQPAYAASASSSDPSQDVMGDMGDDWVRVTGVEDRSAEDSPVPGESDSRESADPASDRDSQQEEQEAARPSGSVESPSDLFCVDWNEARLAECRERVARQCYAAGQDVGSVTDADGNAGLRCVTTGGTIDEEDAEDDVIELLAQLPGAVEEEFAELQIVGGSVSFEPDLLGFGFLNRHTHMFVDVEEQIVETEILGFDVEIRAIPESFQWDYGDGNQRTTYQPGEPLPEYWAGEPVDKTNTETPTSHVYEETGVFEVAVTTMFSGQYRLEGGEWIVISGSSEVSATPGEADIWRQSARNVSGPCRSQEEWGCNGPVELEPGDRPPKIFEDQYDEHGNWIGGHQ
ncbi:hypothetical protein [Nesterenkonia suensis]